MKIVIVTLIAIASQVSFAQAASAPLVSDLKPCIQASNIAGNAFDNRASLEPKTMPSLTNSKTTKGQIRNDSVLIGLNAKNRTEAVDAAFNKCTETLFWLEMSKK